MFSLYSDYDVDLRPSLKMVVLDSDEEDALRLSIPKAKKLVDDDTEETEVSQLYSIGSMR